MYIKPKLAQDTPEGASDIMRTDPKHWARAFFPLGSMCDSVDNNLCESFNNSIIEARLYPCISMLEKVKQNIMAGLPCCHAISAIYKSGRRIEDFIDKCYSVEQFKKIYEHCLEPVEGEERWPISQNPRPQAPGYVSMPGRPRKNDRRREEGVHSSDHETETRVRTIGNISNTDQMNCNFASTLTASTPAQTLMVVTSTQKDIHTSINFMQP